MNCIIIDDDRLSSRVITEFVEKSSQLNLIGVFDNAIDARNSIIKRSDIDLIILDVQMPQMDGFDFISSLSHPPEIIIVTGNGSHALKAFDFNVVDYLVKPINFARFCRAVDKVAKVIERSSINENGSQEIFIKKGSTLVKIKLEDIILVEALENYVILHTDEEKYTIHFTMKAIEQQLPSHIFKRIHRSYIVNKTRINMIRDNSLSISGYEEAGFIPIGKSYREKLLKEINVMLR